ncbi:putative reverse transcriptase domain-containing protein [Tanacetum coccineum]
MTAFETRVRQDTYEIYTRLDDEQKTEARLSREAWRRSMDASDLTHEEVMSLCTTVLGQMSKIRELHAANRRRQAVTSKMLKADHRRSAEIRELRTADRTGDNTTRTSYRTIGTAGTRWRSYTARAARGGWLLCLKIAPKRATRSTPVITTPVPTATTTTSVTNAQLQAMIDQGVTAALAARDANKNGDDSHTSRMGGRRTKRVARECTYQDFMKCKPLYFKGTEGVVELTQWFKRMETILRISNCSGTDVIGYNQHFQELALLCVRMFPEESDKIERYVGGLPDMIHGNIVASKPKTMQEAVEMATELMDKKNKRQNTGRAYTAGTGEKKPYGGSKPLCAKCNYHHDGPCAPKCHKCNKFGHFARDCRSAGNANNANNQRGTGSGQKPTCFECGVQGHFKRECPKLKNNKNRGNQVGNDKAPAKVYAVRTNCRRQT